MTVGIGLLGAGFMGATHAAAYSRIAQVQLVAVAAVDRPQADALAAKYGAKAYYDIDSLLEDPTVQAVDVCLPTFLHEQCVVAAAARGKHVLCEKPIALSLEQVDRMIAAVEAAGVTSMVAQVVRFLPEYASIRQLLQDGVLGQVRAINAERLSPPPSWGQWFKEPNLSGGAVIDLHIHDLDFVYSLCGMPESVFAIGLQSEMGAWDHVNTSLTYREARAHLDASFLMPGGFPFRVLFRLLGSRAMVEYRYRASEQAVEGARVDTELVLYRDGYPPEPILPVGKDGYLAEIEHFVTCVTTGRSPQVATFREARDVLSVALAVRRSMETGRAVQLLPSTTSLVPARAESLDLVNGDPPKHQVLQQPTQHQPVRRRERQCCR